MKLAAIDIGSNAVRLLLSQVIEDGQSGREPFFKKDALVRMPIRLGDDVFTHQHIPDDKVDHLVETMVAFQHLIKAYDAADFSACATSAMREAENRFEVADRIRRATGIELQIIDGKQEAAIIVWNDQDYRGMGGFKSYLHVDVGGGSTDATLFSGKETIASRSFNIGTLRILKKMVSDDLWKELKTWVKSLVRGHAPIAAIGSGGNINKIFDLSLQKEKRPLSLKQLKTVNRTLMSYSEEERVRVLGLRPDRADVIVPAADIFISIMKWAGIKKIFVPQVGLADGLIRMMYEKTRQARTGRAGVPEITGASR